MPMAYEGTDIILYFHEVKIYNTAQAVYNISPEVYHYLLAHKNCSLSDVRLHLKVWNPLWNFLLPKGPVVYRETGDYFFMKPLHLAPFFSLAPKCSLLSKSSQHKYENMKICNLIITAKTPICPARNRRFCRACAENACPAAPAA